MWQRSRQNISGQIIGRFFFDPEYLPFEKKKLVNVRFEHRAFTVPGVFVISRLTLQVILRNLISQ